MNWPFAIVFGIFVVAFVGLSVFIAFWAFKRAKQNRDAWLEQRDKAEGP